MAGYQGRIRSRYLPEAGNSKGQADDNADVESRLLLAEEAGIDYVYFEGEKPNGKKVKILLTADTFKRMSKNKVSKLLKGII